VQVHGDLTPLRRLYLSWSCSTADVSVASGRVRKVDERAHEGGSELTTNALAGIAARDLDAAIPWYERLFDRSPDSCPMSEVAEWKFDGGGWIQVLRELRGRVLLRGC
jgi:hypothetical protein